MWQVHKQKHGAVGKEKCTEGEGGSTCQHFTQPGPKACRCSPQRRKSPLPPGQQLDSGAAALLTETTVGSERGNMNLVVGPAVQAIIVSL